MIGPALAEQAALAGIDLSPRWYGAPEVSAATVEALVAALGAGEASAAGPRQAYWPDALSHRRVFGLALQLYQLRSPRNFGVGDLGDLQALVPSLAAAGCDFVGLNPLHALFLADPERASPFSPSDRRFLNPLIIAADQLPGATPPQDAGAPDASLTVDYAGAARAKLAALRAAWSVWRTAGTTTEADHRAFATFKAEGGGALHDFARFEALSHHMAGEGHGAGWGGWPAPYQDARSAEVAKFCERAADEIEFHTFLQFIAARQVGETQAMMTAAGMAVGLYLDLAVGAARDGAATWAAPDLMMRGVRIGAPPDLFSSTGQDWGLAPFSPTALMADEHRPYKAMLAAVMAPAGAMRIDHVMGLERLYLIPDGVDATAGAYVAQPGLVDAVVDASNEYEAIAIGEDLGVVAPGFRGRMAARRILSMRVVPFEHVGRHAKAPAAYPAPSMACLSTHDIAPLEAWWLGDDIDLRRDLGQLTADDERGARHGRAVEAARLLQLCGLPPRRARGAITDDIVVAFHRLAARTASQLVAIRLEDVLGGRRLVNLPGTDREHPNWRHTLPVTVDDIAASERLHRVFDAVWRVRER